jgi:hypothetical protein
MIRDDAIEIMTEAINKMNREMGYQHNVPSEMLEEQIQTQQTQLNYVNGMLFDLLLEQGYINTNR